MSKEVMQQALNALEFVNKSEDDFMKSECSALVLDAINVLKKALKQKNKVETNILQRQNAFLFKEKLSFEAEAKEWFNKYQEEAEERKKLYELNGILLQKCHTLEKMLANAVQVERQACIDICDAEAEQWQSPKYHYAMAAAVHCARKIKDRNQ